jgi:hypothetical protein
VPRERAIDRRPFALEAGVVDPGAATGPARSAAAEQCGGKRRCRGRVADAHLAETNEISGRRHRVVAGGDGFEELALPHGRRRREVRGRPVEGERQHAQVRAGRAGELIDCRAAGGEVRDHLAGHGRRIGRHALRGDAMVAGEHQHFDLLKPRRRSALPAREPGDDLL